MIIKKFQKVFWKLFFSIFLILLISSLFNIIEFKIFIILSSLVFSIMIGSISMFNPFFLMGMVKKRRWKALVILSFFISIILGISGFFYNEILLYLSIPFITIFLIQFIIEVMDYFGLPGLDAATFLVNYLFFRYLIELVYLLLKLLSQSKSKK